MSRLLALTLFAAIVSATAANAAAPTCTPPPGFVDSPHPEIAPPDELVAHTEEIDIERPLALVVKSLDRPIEDTVHKTSALPGVVGDYVLTRGEFGAPGSRRLNCLSDGSSLVEQVLEKDQSSDAFRFRYVVWNYTTEKARPIVYGVGDFHYTAIAGNRTHVTWTYAFQLNRQRFPGELGGVGDFLFRVGFLDRQYADLMRTTLDGIKTTAER
ncbi:MAG: hypothetical protein ACLQDV_20290 [Candidatus Binataceae bacterium]